MTLSLKKINHENWDATTSSPKIWAIASNSSGVGCSTVAGSIAGILQLKGEKVHIVTSQIIHSAETGIVEKIGDENPSPPSLHLLSKLSSDYYKSLLYIIQRSSFLGNYWENHNSHLIIDIGTSLSEKNLDLFLISDMPVIVVEPTKTSYFSHQIFLKMCLLHLMDSLFVGDNKQLSKVLRELQHKSIEFTQLWQEIRAVCHSQPYKGKVLEKFLHSFSPRLIVNRSNVEQAKLFLKNFTKPNNTYIFPNLSILGTLPDKAQSAEITSQFAQQFLQNIKNQHIKKYQTILKYKMMSFLRSAPI